MTNENLIEIIKKQPNKSEVYMVVNGIKYEIRGYSIENNEIHLKNG